MNYITNKLPMKTISILLDPICKRLYNDTIKKATYRLYGLNKPEKNQEYHQMVHEST